MSVRRGVLLLDRETRAPTHVTPDADNAHSPKHMHTRASLSPFTFSAKSVQYSHDEDRTEHRKHTHNKHKAGLKATNEPRGRDMT